MSSSKVSGKKGRCSEMVPMLLPHEIVDATWRAGSIQVTSIERKQPPNDLDDFLGPSGYSSLGLVFHIQYQHRPN